MTTPAVSAVPRIVKGEGPRTAPIVIVGEYPSAEDIQRGRPFAGASGEELSRMLHDAGILRTECYLTYVAPRAPAKGDIDNFFLKRTAKNVVPSPELTAWNEELINDILSISPKVIITLGELALWSLTGNSGITKWRGSILENSLTPATVIPTYAPSKIMREWSWRYIAVHDLRRAAAFARGEGPQPPVYNFITRPSFTTAMDALRSYAAFADEGELRLAVDIETRAGHIACIGFAHSTTDAICIPFMTSSNSEGYWTEAEEQAIVAQIVSLFRHPNIRWVLQNGLYDLQYFARFYGAVPEVAIDTMLAHHLCFSGLPKSLDFLSSLYCNYHVYWKDEGKDWSVLMNEDQLWSYNCKDAVITLEVSYALDRTLDASNLREQFSFQMLQFKSVLRMMLRGVRQDLKKKGEFNLELMEAEAERQHWLNVAIGRPFNVRSPKQMQEFCYEEMGLPPQRNRKTGSLSCDDKSLEKLAQREPLFRPFYSRISELRSLGVFRATFVQMRLDHDGRVRCSYNIAGTETFRYSSSEDAFGFGGNLQNIPAGDEAHNLPNVRKLFLPDPGYTIFDCDLDRADAQVVAWESNDEILKSIFRAGEDMHLQNARDIFNNPRLTKDSKERKLAKAGCHAINYGAKPPTLARALGITMVEAEKFYNRWFALHPAIADWHNRIEDQLVTTRCVSNKFGFRRYYFDRIENLLPEALAWVPQSTVAIVIDKGLVAVDTTLRGEVDVLLQVHDSLVMQARTRDFERLKPRIRECLRIVIPYDDPLTIGVGIKASTESWGDCVDVAW